MRKKSIKSRKYRGHSPSKRQNILIFHQNPLQHPISALSASHVIIYCGYRYHKIRKAFSKFYYRHSELIVEYNIGLKTLLQQGISDPIFYGDLVYKFKRIVGKPNFSDQFKKIVKRYIRVGYNLDIMRQSACLVLNPITVYSYGFLFNCTTVGQASDSMTALT